MLSSLSAALRGYPWGHQAICFAPLAAMPAALALGIGSGDDLTRYFTALRADMPGLTRGMEFLTNWLIYALYAVYAFFILNALVAGNRSELRRGLIFILAQLLCTVLLVQFLKIAIGRPRPLVALGGAEFAPWVLNKDYHSFPSGHTAESAGAASVLAVRFRRPALSLFLGLIIALVAFSRLYLSRHHLSDIVGGACAGLAASLLNFHLCSEIRHD